MFEVVMARSHDNAVPEKVSPREFSESGWCFVKAADVSHDDLNAAGGHLRQRNVCIRAARRSAK